MESYIEVPIDGEIIKKLLKLTKKELVEKFCVAALDAEISNKKIIDMQTKLDKAEAYVEQGRAMIESVMERWNEYDV